MERLITSACILAVETAFDVRLDIQFYTSLEKAKGGLFPEVAKTYFGHIDSWEKFAASNIPYDKNLVP